ncbi:uncharacterized protein METZ01_LOCUS106286 [marine metagenome]|uniref:Uncharacterized protein n=1 Tax=marine metagenome TaxID=408172 RepID=A0A381WLY8_9ZZZZ
MGSNYLDRYLAIGCHLGQYHRLTFPPNPAHDIQALYLLNACPDMG